MAQLAIEEAVAAAERADAVLARGDKVGPLHGVPFTVKDVFEVEGLISAVGLPERVAMRAARDAAVVARMRAAGGILLGTTNTPPGGSGTRTDNAVYGRTTNPYGRVRSPGGSSGGEAAVIAACGSPLGLGSDSGGSIRLPAHFCGIAGLKPTTGRVPNTGAFEHPGGLADPRTQIGPMARSVRDLALCLPLIVGEDGRDSGVVPMPLHAPEQVQVDGLRVAYYIDDGVSTPTPGIAGMIEQCAAALASAGARVVSDCPSCFAETWPITRAWWSVWGFGDADEQPASAVLPQLLVRWNGYRSAMLAYMANYDVIVCPTDARPAPTWAELDTSSASSTAGYAMFSYTLPYNLTGWPALTLRCGTSPEGLPLGVQIVARPWREDVALAVGQVLEEAFGGWQPPPVLVTC